jgi:hypothetical protein
MGPIIIFDKSVLESLNPDEAVWLDHSYLSNITPLFFIETLADLEKQVRKGRAPEQIVGSLASKTPEFGKLNTHHRTLLEGELSGAAQLDMRMGRPHLVGGKHVELGGKTGVVFQEAPEEEAFRRWQRGEFLEVERSMARAWRRALSGIDLEATYRAYQGFFPLGRPRNLAGVKRIVDFHIDDPDQRRTLDFALTRQGVTPRFRDEIINRWRSAGEPQIRVFAPYLTHLLSVDLFFDLAIAADLIGRHRPSNKVDLAYLYYLPFCMVFTSNDNLHRQIVPLFLRDNQTFVLGADLKADLAKLDAHYDALPEETKRSGIMSFAFYPPHDTGFLITRLWDKHMAPGWREVDKAERAPRDPAMEKALAAEIMRMEKEATAVPAERQIGSDQADSLIIKRTVRARRGKWNIVSPEIANRRKNEKGEWEDGPPEQ